MTGSDFDLGFATPEDVLVADDGRLVDVLDHLLDAGVVLRGELWLSVADVDLVFIGLQAVLSNPDTINGEGRQA
jgi:hypothetical protein